MTLVSDVENTVDVFIPCHNYGRYLDECVESALSQAGCKVRVLIIDDASTDDSLAIARRIAAADPRVEVLEHPVNRGHIATFNEGIAWASAEYMTLVSADDLLAPGALARATNVMRANPNVGFAYGRLIHFSEDGELRAARREAQVQGPNAPATIRSGADFIRGLCERPENPVAASGVVVRTRLQQKVGGYLKELPHAGDLEMWLRLAAHADLAIFEAPQALVRLHVNNMRHDYYADRMFEDYRQRHLAFEMFFESQASVLGARADLMRTLRSVLGAEVLWAAGHCFDEADAGSASRLTRLARTIDPGIMRRPYWWKLAAKRLVGPRACQAISPIFAPRREVAASFD